MGVFESFLSTPEVTEVLSDRSFVAAMLRYQAALSRAQANAGMDDLPTVKVEIR